MATTSPAYNIIKALKLVGITNPEDRAWKQIDVPINDQAFIKYECDCAKRHKIENNKDLNVEVILKPYYYTEKKKLFKLFVGQCPLCEKIYWLWNE